MSTNKRTMLTLDKCYVRLAFVLSPLQRQPTATKGSVVEGEPLQEHVRAQWAEGTGGYEVHLLCYRTHRNAEPKGWLEVERASYEHIEGQAERSEPEFLEKYALRFFIVLARSVLKDRRKKAKKASDFPWLRIHRKGKGTTSSDDDADSIRKIFQSLYQQVGHKDARNAYRNLEYADLYMRYYFIGKGPGRSRLYPDLKRDLKKDRAFFVYTQDVDAFRNAIASEEIRRGSDSTRETGTNKEPWKVQLERAVEMVGGHSRLLDLDVEPVEEDKKTLQDIYVCAMRSALEYEGKPGQRRKRKTPLSRAIRKRAAEIADEMLKTWQELPDVPPQIPPMATGAKVEIYEGNKIVAEQHYSSPWKALERTLHQTPRCPVVLFGEPGAGKSSWMKWMARELAMRFVEEGGEAKAPYPLYVDFGNQKARNGQISSYFENPWDKKMAAGDSGIPVAWLLDGLDLLPDNGKEILDLGNIASWLGIGEKGKATAHDRFLFSTRPNLVASNALDHKPASIRMSLCLLDPEERKSWVHEYYGHHAGIEDRLEEFQALAGCDSSLMSNPLLFGMILTICLEPQTKGSTLGRIRYPGRAGLLDSFVTYALRRQVGRSISAEEYKSLSGRSLHKFEGICWTHFLSAAKRGRSPDRLPRDEVPLLWQRAFGNAMSGQDEELWNRIIRILEKSGLVWDCPSERSWRVPHQQVLEHWAARHLAGHLIHAAENSRFESELWHHLEETRVDVITSQALSMLSAQKHDRLDLQELVIQAFGILEDADRDIEHSLRFVAAVGGEVALEFLTRLLRRSDDPWECHNILMVLQNFTTAEAAASAIEVMMDETNDLCVRMDAASILGNMGRQEAVAPLLAVLKARRLDAERPKEKSRRPLSPGYGNPLVLKERLLEPELRSAVALALGQLGAQEAIEALDAVAKDLTECSIVAMDAAIALSNLSPDESLSRCLHQLREGTAEERRRAVDLLTEYRSPEALRGLSEAVKDSNGSVRADAAMALGILGMQTGLKVQAVESLADATGDRLVEVRKSATLALGVTGAEGAVEPLLSVLAKERSSSVREMAVFALGAIGSQKSKSSLIQILRDETTSSALRAGILRALRKLRERNEATQSELHAEVASALGTLHGEGIADDIVKVLEEGKGPESLISEAALSAGELRIEKASSHLMRIARERKNDKELRCECLRAIGRIAEPGTITMLRELLHDEDEYPQVRGAAAAELGEFESDDVLSDLVSVIMQEQHEEGWRICEGAENALSKILENQSQQSARSFLGELLAKPGFPPTIACHIARSAGLRIRPPSKDNTPTKEQEAHPKAPKRSSRATGA